MFPLNGPTLYFVLFCSRFVQPVSFLTTLFLGKPPGVEFIKLLSCSTQLSMKFKMLINIEMAKIDGIFSFNSLKPAIYPDHKC